MNDLPTREEFEPYFNCADEIDESLRAGVDQSKQSDLFEPLTLADLDREWVDAARALSHRYGLPWPPSLPEAEEFALDITNQERRSQ